MFKEAKIPMSREEKLFRYTPVWKTLLLMAIPSMALMLIFGLYTFMDNVLAINLADYDAKTIGERTYERKDLVRLFMSGISPVITFMFAITMLFGVGVSRRYSINLGAGREERAKQTIKTTMQIALGVSLVLIPVLIFASKPWIKSQYSGEPEMANLISDKGFDYVWIIIMAFPMQMFNQIVSSLLRAEAKNKQVLISQLFPILINLLMDWILMGPCGMGIEGGAWATFISYLLTTIILSFYMLTLKTTRIKFKNFIGFHGFKAITIIGVILVGISPFMRNMAQSITQTIETRTMQEVSQNVYGNKMQMNLVMSAVFPIFGLFFPMLFGFVQAASPIIGYNYGAGDIKRVKQATWYVVLYSTIVAVMIYIISTFLLMDYLNKILGVQNQLLKGGVMFHTLDKTQKMYGIMMFGAIVFGPSLGAMALFGSTDRIMFSIFASLLRGLLLLIPFLFIFKAITDTINYDTAQNLSGENGIFSKEYIFWWFYPALSITTSITLLSTLIYTLKHLDKKRTTLEERISKIYLNQKNRKNKKLAKEDQLK